jgi:hypothetical protein
MRGPWYRTRQRVGRAAAALDGRIARAASRKMRKCRGFRRGIALAKAPGNDDGSEPASKEAAVVKRMFSTGVFLLCSAAAIAAIVVGADSLTERGETPRSLPAVTAELQE